MGYFQLLILGVGLLALAVNAAGSQPLLWSDHPAVDWEREAYPLGNGRMGGMLFGGVDREKIQLNVDSLWTGDENPSGDYGQMGEYNTLGTLGVTLERPAGSEVSDYRRELDLQTAIHRVRYRLGEVQYHREMFVSYPDDVMVLRFDADQPAALSGRIELVDGRTNTTQAGAATLAFAGTLRNGLKYETQVLVIPEGGTTAADGDAVTFAGCDGLTILLAADTDYRMDYGAQWRGEDPHAQLLATVEAALKKGYAALKDAHVKDHQALFDRVRIDLGESPSAARNLPTEKRIQRYRELGDDRALEALLFQYGRYLLIASSRPGSLPANLQGIWNDRNDPPWHSDYHSNINLQMNYWLAEPANLAECHEPLMDWLSASLEPYRTATRASFGAEVKGFTMRTSQNIYGGMGWAWNIPASAWYAQHYWEHYAFGQDLSYLKRQAYPYLKEVCAFWESHLKTLPDGRLVAPDGWSPEHGPREDGVSHDQQIIWDLFQNTIAAADALGGDEVFREHIASMQKRLVGPKIGKWGQLQEWMEDRDDPNTDHRHTSHLFAVYPGRQISREQTPELATAAAVSLAARGESGDSRRSWTWPWRCGLWARLGEAENCHRMVARLITYNMLPNLLATHPPLQLDGSFGITGGMCEMLLQSQVGELVLLPALPQAWATGSVTGLRARGGFTVDMEWGKGRLLRAEIHSTAGTTCTLRTMETVHVTCEGGGVEVTHDRDGTSTFATLAGRSYVVQTVGERGQGDRL